MIYGIFYNIIAKNKQDFKADLKSKKYYCGMQFLFEIKLKISI